MVHFRHLEFKMADDAHCGFLRTFGMLFSMGLRCYEPIFSLVLIFSTFILLSACTNSNNVYQQHFANFSELKT